MIYMLSSWYFVLEATMLIGFILNYFYFYYFITKPNTFRHDFIVIVKMFSLKRKKYTTFSNLFFKILFVHYFIFKNVFTKNEKI